MKLNSHNEWDRLRAVVVGTVDGFVPGLESKSAAEVPDTAREIASLAYPPWYLDEVAEDLHDLCEIFRRAGVEVIRPTWTEPSPSFRTPNWAAEGFDLYNVRDLHIIFGNTLVVSAPASRFRLFERYAFHDLLYEHFFPDGLRWISAPLPRLRGQYLRELERPRTSLERTEEQMHTHLSHGLSEVFHELEETEVIFDAANIIRVGRDVLFLISSTGNKKAADWLRTTLGSEYEVHLTHSYRSSHLDSTIMPLRTGTVLLNGARVNEMTSPAVFRHWDRIYFADVAPVPEPEVEFYRSVRLPAYHALQELGVDSPLGHISSAWGGLNVLSLDPETVLVHDRQIGLTRVLEKRGFTVVPVRMRHCYTMLGGLHCTTLDVIREEN